MKKVKIYSKTEVFNDSKTVPAIPTIFPQQAGYEFETNIAILDGKVDFVDFPVKKSVEKLFGILEDRANVYIFVEERGKVVPFVVDDNSPHDDNERKEEFAKEVEAYESNARRYEITFDDSEQGTYFGVKKRALLTQKQHERYLEVVESGDEEELEEFLRYSIDVDKETAIGLDSADSDGIYLGSVQVIKLF